MENKISLDVFIYFTNLLNSNSEVDSKDDVLLVYLFVKKMIRELLSLGFDLISFKCNIQSTVY